jgi:hypothetical protein
MHLLGIGGRECAPVLVEARLGEAVIGEVAEDLLCDVRSEGVGEGDKAVLNCGDDGSVQRDWLSEGRRATEELAAEEATPRVAVDRVCESVMEPLRTFGGLLVTNREAEVEDDVGEEADLRTEALDEFLVAPESVLGSVKDVMEEVRGE